MSVEVELVEGCSVRGSTTSIPSAPTVPVYTFLSVPYAQPPVGPHRLKPTVPLHLWKGCRDATKYGAICPQNLDIQRKFLPMYDMPTEQSEDCLYLNVWTPSLDPDAKLAVMLWIHGGSFISGFGDFYVGTAIAALQNVIHVSINYRLGPFGFISTGDSACPGNMGLWDQIESLRWVQTYICRFGGDPNNVTVYGESAGGISIEHLLIVPQTRGLFKRVILQSGTAFVPGTFWSQRNTRKYICKRVASIGCTSVDTTDMMKFLHNATTQELLSLGDGFQIVRDDILISYDSTDVQRVMEPRGVDVMVGVTSHEGANFLLEILKAVSTDSNRTGAAKLLVPSKHVAWQVVEYMVKVMFYRGQPSQDAVIEAIYSKYFGSIRDDDLQKVTMKLVDVLSLLMFIVPALRSAKVNADIGHPTYLYLFDHKPSFELVPFPEWVKAIHGHDIAFVMGEPFLERFNFYFSLADKVVCESVMTYWANFAKTGDPNDRKMPHWMKYSSSNKQYMTLGSQCVSGCGLCEDDYHFWTVQLPKIQDSKQTAKY